MHVHSRKAQLEPMLNWMQRDVEKDCEGKTKVLSTTMKLARPAIPSAKWSQSTSHVFDRQVAAEHAQAMVSSVMCE